MAAHLWKLLDREAGWITQRITSEPAPLHLDAAQAALPGGAYTTFRTYQHSQALHLEDHFHRLEETTRLADFSLALDRTSLRLALRELLLEFPVEQELRLRLVIDLEKARGEIYAAAEPLRLPSVEEYQNGVKTITRPFARPNPRAKLTGAIARAYDLRKGLPPDINEVLITNPAGEILEGLSSNFFAVLDGRLFTAGEGVLAGITRLIVLDEASAAGVAVVFSPAKLADLPALQEAFITSASRAVLPVYQADDQVIGSGAPGPLTRLLAERFNRRLALEILPI